VNNISNVFLLTIPISVQASGNKKTDQAMIDRLHTILENKMVEFAAKEQRSGGMLNGKRFV